MSYSGLSYPKDEKYLTTIKNSGQFILVDRNAAQISVISGGTIKQLLSENSQLLFVFELHIAGIQQDIVDSLYLSGYNLDDIAKSIASGINIDNINTPAAQQWIEIFKEQNIQPTKIMTDKQITRPKAPTPQHGEHPPNLSYPVTSTYTLPYIAFLRETIHDAIATNYLNGNPNFDQITTNFLQKMFQMYDRMFFGDKLDQIMKQKNTQLTVEFSDRLTKTGGKCSNNGCHYTIKLSQPIITGTFRKGEKLHMANGLECYNRLECLMNIFEHELIHFVIGITHGHIEKDAVYGSHGEYFKQLVKVYFGHTAYKHALLLNIETPGKREDWL